MGAVNNSCVSLRRRGRLNLPYDVPANQFMNLEGQKISGSRNWAVWGLDFLERYDPDRCATTHRQYARAARTDWD